MAILEELCQFFSRNPINSIEFWECPSRLEWHLHKAVDLETKASNPTPVYPCKTSWDYSKKTECDDILNIWKMMFQASDGKGNRFLDLLDDNLLHRTILCQGRSLATVVRTLKLVMCMHIESNHKSCSYWRI